MDTKMYGIFFILAGISGIINAGPFSWLSPTDVDEESLIYNYVINHNFPKPCLLRRAGLIRVMVNGKRFNTNLKKNEIENSKRYFPETSLDDSGSTVTKSKASHLESRNRQFQTPGSIFKSGYADISETSTFNSQILQSKLEITEKVIESSERTEIIPVDRSSTADENSSTTDENDSITNENYSIDENYSNAEENSSIADKNSSITNENYSIDENYSNTEENSSIADENSSVTDKNSSITDKNYSTADENYSTAVFNESSIDHETLVTSGITKSEPVVTETPMSSDASTDSSPTSNPIESTHFPNLESSSQGEETLSTSIAPSREPVTDFNTFSSTIKEEVSVSMTTIRELTDATIPTNSISSPKETVSPKSEYTTIAADHIVRISSIRTARMIVSIVFIVVALVAASILAVYIFSLKRRAVQYDQLLLLH